MASFVYQRLKRELVDAGIDWAADTFKVALLSNLYSPDQDGDDYFSEVSTYEISGAGYTAGGETLSSKTVTDDDANNEVESDAGDVSWTGLTGSFRYAVLYKDTGTESTSPLLFLLDFGATQTASADDVSIQWNSEGVFKLT
jgi:hypothetical protein